MRFLTGCFIAAILSVVACSRSDVIPPEIQKEYLGKWRFDSTSYLMGYKATSEDPVTIVSFNKRGIFRQTSDGRLDEKYRFKIEENVDSPGTRFNYIIFFQWNENEDFIYYGGIRVMNKDTSELSQYLRENVSSNFYVRY